MGGNISDLPAELRPVSIRKIQDTHIWIDGHRAFLEQLDDNRSNVDERWWMKNVEDKDVHIRELMRYMTVFVTRDEMKHILKNDSLVLVAAGSFHPDYLLGTAGIVVETKSGYSVAKGFCRTHSHQEDQSAYRSELMGILMGLTWLQEMLSVIGTTTVPVTFACDNSTAVYKCFHSEDYVNAKHSNTDLIWTIQQIIWNTKIELHGLHVKGHQDEAAQQKDPLARMNDIAHHLATDFLRFCIIYNAPAPSDIPTQMWRVQLDGRMIVSDVEKAILGHTYNDDMKAYRMKQGNIANELYHQVNWKAYGDLNKSMTHRERIFNIKLQTGFLPTANRMHMFDENTSSRCPCCGHLHENITHMLYCNKNLYRNIASVKSRN